MNGSKMDSPSHSEIAARAEQIYVESGRVAGRDLENWIQAENELKQSLAGKAKGASPAKKNSNGAQRREKQGVSARG